MSKSSVQIRIESWQPSRPTLKSLQSRLLEAARRRDAMLAQGKSKVQKMNRKKSTLSIRKDECLVKEKLQAKRKKADSAKKKLREKFASIMTKKRQKIEMIKENRALAQDERESTLERKLNAAEIRKDMLLTQIVVSKREENSKKMAKVNQIRNESVEKLSNLEDSSRMKLEAAQERKDSVLNEIKINAANENKRKEEKTKLHIQRIESKLVSSSKKLIERLEHASERKDYIINAIKDQSSHANSHVLSRVKEISRQRASRESDMMCRYENKLLSSSKRSVRCVPCNTPSMSADKKNHEDQGKLFKLAETSKSELLKEKLDKKMQNAAERREVNLKSKVLKACQRTRQMSLSPKSTDIGSSVKRCQIMTKLEEATARREKILTKRVEHASSFAKRSTGRSDSEISTVCGIGIRCMESSPISCSPMNLDFKLFNAHEKKIASSKDVNAVQTKTYHPMKILNWLLSKILAWFV